MNVSRYFIPQYVFTTTDAQYGTLYMSKRFWFRFSALNCLMFHNKFKSLTELEENEMYSLEYTVVNIVTGEIIK